MPAPSNDDDLDLLVAYAESAWSEPRPDCAWRSRYTPREALELLLERIGRRDEEGFRRLVQVTARVISGPWPACATAREAWRYLPELLPGRGCFACGGEDFWVSPAGIRRCRVCHPHPASTG